MKSSLSKRSLSKSDKYQHCPKVPMVMSVRGTCVCRFASSGLQRAQANLGCCSSGTAHLSFFEQLEFMCSQKSVLNSHSGLREMDPSLVWPVLKVCLN